MRVDAGTGIVASARPGANVGDGIDVGDRVGIGIVVEVIALVGEVVEVITVVGAGIEVSSSVGTASIDSPPHATNPSNAMAHRTVLKRIANCAKVILSFPAVHINRR